MNISDVKKMLIGASYEDELEVLESIYEYAGDDVMNGYLGSSIMTVSYDSFGKVEFDSTKDFKVGHVASFAYADDNYLYAGEFASSGDYEKSNYVETNDGTYFAICSVFSLDDMSLVKVYSIRNKVQGFCVTENGTIVLSTSQSFYSSEYYIYNQSDIRKAENNIVKGEEIDVPLYILDTPSKIIKGTCMSEDLSYYNGKVYTLTESACNKYILGKFFFAYDIFSLDIE
jgi:hypothetical protein